MTAGEGKSMSDDTDKMPDVIYPWPMGEKELNVLGLPAGYYLANAKLCGDEDVPYHHDRVVTRLSRELDETKRWHQVLDDALITTWCLSADNMDNPQKALADVIEWHVHVATDPRVNGGQVLVDQRELEAKSERVKALEDGMYSAETKERAAKALWDRTPHKLLEKGGYPIDWESQPPVMKKKYLNDVGVVIKALLPTTQETEE